LIIHLPVKLLCNILSEYHNEVAHLCFTSGFEHSSEVAADSQRIINSLFLPNAKYMLLYLAAHQKYALETTPLTKGRYEVVIKHMQNNQWTHSVYRDTQEDF